MSRFYAALGLALILFAGSAGAARAAQGIKGSPRIINLYLDWQMRDEDLPALAKWDVVVLDADQQARYPDKIRRLRQLNPAIKILAYVPSEEIPDARFSEPANFPFARLAAQIRPEWYLKSPTGERVYFWPGTSMLDVTDRAPQTGERWNEFLPRFIRDEIMSSGLWDGVFLDNVFDGVSYFAKSPIDFDRDGKADQPDAAWRAGMRKLLKNVRALNPNALIIGNGNGYYADQLNGAFFEHFPSYSWGPNWQEFRDAVTKNLKPSYTALNVNTDNEHRPADYRLMRFGLASALVGGGAYSFDKGDWNHNVTWWYDEYELPLGSPLPEVRKLTASQGSASAVWSRSFEWGLVLVNGTDKAQRVALPGVYEKIRGTQDSRTNDGSIVSYVDLPPRDGLLLLRRASANEIRGATFTNGSFMRIYAADGTQRANGFFARHAAAPDGAEILVQDLDGDSADDLAYAEKGKVTIKYASGKNRTFQPWKKYTGRIYFAAGQANRDSLPELVLGRENDSEVLLTDQAGKILARWQAYLNRIPGGVKPAIGDLDRDDRREVVTVAGPGGGPHIRIWKTDGAIWGGGFFAFDATQVGGAAIAVGDVDGDGRDEIVAASGRGASPRVRIFSGAGILKKDFAVSGTAPQGLRVSLSDVDTDGRPEIIIGGVNPF